MGTQITGGVDTHLDVHVAAALDDHGGLLGTASFATTPDGYRELARVARVRSVMSCWSVSKGPAATAPGLTRHLQADGHRGGRGRPTEPAAATPGRASPTRTTRSSAARAAFAGDALGAPKTRDGNVEAIRVLRLARNSATRDRTRALNQMRSLDHHCSRRAALPAPRADHPETGAHRRRRSVPRDEPMSPARIVSRSRRSPAASSNSTTRSRALDALLTPLVAADRTRDDRTARGRHRHRRRAARRRRREPAPDPQRTILRPTLRRRATRRRRAANNNDTASAAPVTAKPTAPCGAS